MAEIKNSEFLSEIIYNAKLIGGKDNTALTAEKFIVSLLDAVTVADGTSGELLAVKKLLEAHKIEISETKNILMVYISENKGASFVDGLYLHRKLYEAKETAQKQGLSELTADNLLSQIFADPSNSVKEILGINNPEKNEEALQAELAEAIKQLSKIDAALEKERAKAEESDVDSESDSESDSATDSTHNSKEGMDYLVNKVERIRAELQEHIYGQDNAINTFVNGYFQANLVSLIDKSRKRPKATFLFAGPPGVGKTFLAEKAAESLELPYKRFDMSEYADKDAHLEFCGYDDSYRGAKQGNVTGFVAKNPECVLLFDEIEKAHINVIYLFLQMLDAGRLRDNNTDKEVSFTDTIIILTTNAGKQLYEESEGLDLSSISRKVIINALETDIDPNKNVPYFPSAICSRFASGNVVMFNHMAAHNLRGIAKKEMEKQASHLDEMFGIKLKVDDEVCTAILFSEGSAADARTVRSRAESFFNNELYELLRLVASDKVKTGIADLEEVHITLDMSQAKKEISSLFECSTDTKMLVFADEESVKLCKSKIASHTVMGTQSYTDAIEILKNNEIGFVLIDVYSGISANTQESLNIEDVDSPARDFYKFLCREGKGVPVYLLEQENNKLSNEEKISYIRQGIRGIVPLNEDGDSFENRINEIAAALHQQASMESLAMENKLVSFETAQTVSKDGKEAEIRLFDFEMTVAVDSEDRKSILSAVSRPDIKFDDVIGAGEAKKELAYFVEYLKNPKKYMGTGVKPPRGVLLHGSPGTGKTMLAKAMASEAGVTFIAAEGNQFLKKYVGEGSEKVHELFRTARKYAPSILFVDEIDAIAKERKGASESSSGIEATLTAFLTEMDGFTSDPTKPVFVLAATNFEVEPGRAKSLDPALMRRFDRRVYIDLPDRNDRIKFIRKKIEKNPALKLSADQIENTAMRSTGMSLAELDSIVELALRSAIRDGSTVVTDEIFEEAFETFNSGEVKKWDVSQLERVARHEAGHTLICCLSGETPSYLTIVARGNHGGYMQHAEQEGKAIYTKDELLAKIRTSLGGRAAEIVYYGDRDGISTGASGDLVSATLLAQKIVCTYGMDDEFGLAVVNDSGVSGGAMSMEVRNAVNAILKEQMNEAIRLISENKEKIDALVDCLMEKNYLKGSEIEQVIQIKNNASKITGEE